ncbi:Acyl-CoA synthetase (AMP-forming)/AMP-acid ligase II [Mycobacterium rhizamassiliense]|uniref:Acyl-CoA synthetase (AMP-forming)/AMP-acid ligase II n=2 Tax=Mycobacterium TaxID=1763 RepID=A0A2U3PA61_9MYCO|nr:MULTISPECIES: AMP-binding protein [Mycobacterium]SPM34830.1 Acyl-CoA synthetase (AMP-forming)/AMP-acid ligase II [Mycobacterium rhizamassiliense]SPM40657.1 Acyl-CoA synthetase (AMP-forming)/AMP-acid ligase II [Mycobacterium numidiamassiliense]
MKPGKYTDRYAADSVRAYRDAELWSDETMFDLLVRQAAQQPDKVFATDRQRSLTYRELHDSVLRLAAGLHERGWRAGDTVAVQLPNWVEFIEVTAALSRLGVITVPIMPIYRRDEVGYVTGHAEARAVIAPATFKGFDYLGMYRDVRRERPELDILVARPDATTHDIASQKDSGVTILDAVRTETVPAADDLPAQPSADDPFVIVYTSGTTSRPKGCVHTFNTYCSGARSLTKAFGYTESDVQFGPSPITHTTGLVTSVLVPMLNGGATHVMADWEPKRGLAEIAEFGCTQAVTATTFLQMLLSVFDPERDDASSLRLWVCAGAPIPRAVVEQATTTLPGMRVLSLYGRSENLVATTCTVSDDPDRALTSDGSALDGHEVAIVDEDGREIPRGTEGDIAYRGPSHMIGYLGDPEETAALFTPTGFSRSGDLGVMDEDGFVRVTGRVKDIIIRGGMNISAREIEDHLAAHPALSASAVVGFPDERLGERVSVFVVTRVGEPEPTVEELRAYLTGHGVAIQKTPERVIKVAELPMTATGKVQKHMLREQVSRTVENNPVGVNG